MRALAYQMDRRVTIQAPSTVQDAAGQPVAGWSDVATLWASIIDLSGREYIAAGGTQNMAETKITIRHRAGITPAMRVVYGADIYKITAVLGQDNRTLLLMCARFQ